MAKVKRCSYICETMKGEYKIELPLDDDVFDSRFDHLAERKFEDPFWREDAKKYLLKKIEEAVIFNLVYKGQAEEREIDPLWVDTIDKIDRIEKELVKNGRVLDYGIYQRDHDSDNNSGKIFIYEAIVILSLLIFTHCCHNDDF